MNYPHPFTPGTTVYDQAFGVGTVTENEPNDTFPELGIVSVEFPDYQGKHVNEVGPINYWVTGVLTNGSAVHPTLSLHRNWTAPTTSVKIIAGTPVFLANERGTAVAFYCDRMVKDGKVFHYVIPASNDCDPYLREVSDEGTIIALANEALVKMFPEQVAKAIESTADDFDDIPF